MMGVCSGLLLALCLLVTGIACKTCRHARTPPPARRSPLKKRGEDESSEGDSSEEDDVSKVLVSPLPDGQTGAVRSVDVFASAEELEKARRLEERERIIRDIWRNGQPDILVTGTGTVGRVHYH